MSEELKFLLDREDDGTYTGSFESGDWYAKHAIVKIEKIGPGDR